MGQPGTIASTGSLAANLAMIPCAMQNIVRPFELPCPGQRVASTFCARKTEVIRKCFAQNGEMSAGLPLLHRIAPLHVSPTRLASVAGGPGLQQCSPCEACRV